MTITIYHNPDCGTSRNTLAMIRQSGEEPEVIEYLKTPPSRERLVELIAAMGISPRELLRRKGTPYDALGLDDPKWTDDELIDLMLKHPILINRNSQKQLVAGNQRVNARVRVWSPRCAFRPDQNRCIDRFGYWPRDQAR